MAEQKILMQLLGDIEDAVKSHESATREAMAARSRETDALNTLNRLQKQFDKLVTETKAAAPRESDWKRNT